MQPAQHDHQLDLGVSIGPTSLRVVMLGVVSLVACYALLRPFVPAQLGVRLPWVTAAAGAGVLLTLLLATGTTIPRQVLVLLVVAAAVPIYATHRSRSDVPPAMRRAAPFVLAVAGAGAAVSFARSLLDGAGPATVPALYDGLVLALVGLSWYALCGPRSRPAAALAGAGAWLLASAAVAGAGHVTMLALAGT